MAPHRIVLKFPHSLLDQPIVYRLVKDYDLELNILKAHVTPEEEGLLVLELKGTKANYDKGSAYLKGRIRFQLSMLEMAYVEVLLTPGDNQLMAKDQSKVSCLKCQRKEKLQVLFTDNR